MNIDLHSHSFPEPYLHVLRSHATVGKVSYQVGAGGHDSLLVEGGRRRVQLTERHCDPGTLVTAMNVAELDLCALSPSPTMFHYELEGEFAAKVSRSINVGFADMAAGASGRHVLFATVPMQDSTLARRELDFAVENLAARGMAIASNIEGRNLDDPEFLPIFRHAAALGLPIFIHPSNVLGHDRLTSYYLENLIGNPVDTAAAVASLIFGGVLDLCPDLRFILCHGGGVVPALMGRWAHGYRVRPEPRANINRSPETYLSRFYCDTITHDPVPLRALIDAVSDANVVLGSDYPFDMGDPDPVGTLRSVKDLSDTSFHRIAGGNAAALLGLEVVPGA